MPLVSPKCWHGYWLWCLLCGSKECHWTSCLSHYHVTLVFNSWALCATANTYIIWITRSTIILLWQTQLQEVLFPTDTKILYSAWGYWGGRKREKKRQFFLDPRVQVARPPEFPWEKWVSLPSVFHSTHAMHFPYL